jgi:hypothetical protein
MFVEVAGAQPIPQESNMLRSVEDLQNYAIRATDGTLAHVKDLYFDDRMWVVRYLVSIPVAGFPIEKC